MTVNNEKTYSRVEVAAILGVHPMTIWREIRRGNLKAFKIGKKDLRVTESSLNEYIKRQEVKK